MKKGYRLMFAVFMSCSLLFASVPVCAATVKDNTSVVRVAFPIQKGLTELDSAGNYSGYTYDYLMEISQYTDWKYEFVQVDGDLDTQISTLLKMLENGEIDLMGCMDYTDELAQKLDYTGYNYGMAYNALCVLNENEELNEFNLLFVNSLRVAVLKGERPQLTQFGQMNGIEVEQVVCETTEEQITALKTGKADALLAINLSVPNEEVRIIACFSPKPFYFATTRGKTEIISVLNTAISTLNSINPYFETNLNEKYFGTEKTDLTLTRQEKDYISLSEPIQVVMMGEEAPIQYVDDEGNIQGISFDVLNYITDHTGLTFEYQYITSFDDYIRILQNKEADLAVGVVQNYHKAQEYGYTLSIPYLDAPIAVAINDKVDSEDLTGKNFALPDCLNLSETSLEAMTYYDNIERCLEAVHRGEMDYCCGNSYSVQYYIGQCNYKNVLTIPQSEQYVLQYCFGVVKPANPNLLSILNKAIRSIPEEETQQMIYRNASYSRDVTLLDYLKANPIQAAIIGSLLVLCFIIMLLIWYVYHSKKINRQIVLDKERYRQVSELSNEYLYEYDIINDRLTLSEKSARYFQLAQITENFSEYLKRMVSDQESLAPFQKKLAAVCGSNEEMLCELKNGERRWMRITSKMISDDKGVPTFTIGKVTDIQEEKEERERLEKKALLDSMTGVYNSAAIRTLIRKHVDGKHAHGALYMLDVDHFKKINDRFGHYTGDRVLMRTAKILRKIFREEHLIGRIGGDEFAVYQKKIQSSQEAEDRCQEIQKMLRDTCEKEGLTEVSLSIGCALTREGDTLDVLYIRADQALYQVKHSGRNGFQVEQ